MCGGREEGRFLLVGNRPRDLKFVIGPRAWQGACCRRWPRRPFCRPLPLKQELVLVEPGQPNEIQDAPQRRTPRIPSPTQPIPTRLECA